MVNVERDQHSPGTATIAPQISPLFPGANSNNDTWSLSYAPSDNISRTTTVDRPPPAEEPVPEQPKYANLGPPGYPGDVVDAKDGLKIPPVPSPQVSAISSTNQDDVPSRSISEVTRPDEQAQQASPAGSILHHRDPRGIDAEAHSTAPLSRIAKNPGSPSPTSLYTPNMQTPLSGRDTLPAVPRHIVDEPQSTTSSGSHYSQPVANVQPPLGSTEIESSTDNNNNKSGATSPSGGLEPRQSVVSAISSPSPGQPRSDHDGLSPTGTHQSVSPAPQDIKVENRVPAVSPPAMSPPYEDATPPYSTTQNAKEAEAAAERSLSASQAHRQSLPAYQSPIQEKAPPTLLQPPAIVPVADLSAKRREEDRRPPSRPFSFVDTNHEDILHRHTASKDTQLTSGTGSSLSKELGLEMNGSGERRHSRSSSRPFSGADLGQHPALRGLVDSPLPSQTRGLAPPPRLGNRSSPPSAHEQPEQQYRIPGPYGQQFKFTNPISFSSEVGQSSLQRPPQSAPLANSARGAEQLAKTGRKHHLSDNSILPLSTTEHSLPGISPSRSPEPTISTLKLRTGATRLLHPRSKSRAHQTSDEDESGPRDIDYKEDKKKDKGGSMFRPHSREDSESTSGQFGGTKENAAGSLDALTFYQRSPNLQGYGAMQDETKKKGKDRKMPKKLQRATTSNSQPQYENKKKAGFLRLSGFFGKSGKESPPPLREQPFHRPDTLQPMLNPPLPRASAPATPAPYQEPQTAWRVQDQARYRSEQRTNSFRGQAPPVRGYYAPPTPEADPTAYQPILTPRDPDAFIGGRRLSDQRAAEQARHLQSIAGLRSQNQAENLSQPPPPQFTLRAQPQSAPASAQHFDRSQTQQPRSVSHRFPPDLRIDTSGRINANRRSHPIPVMGANSLQDSASRGRGSSSENPINNIPTHSNSTPQRHSPYADRTSQHSPYGYGTARGLRKDNLSHAIDLHKRSRSPRNGRRDSFDSQEDKNQVQDPANKLGTFSETHRSRSQRGEPGEDDGQEKPWKIDIPVADDPKPRSAAEKMMGVGVAGGGQRNPLSSAAGNSKVVPPAELPGSKAPGDVESDEEIVMCSTAYPGQEWVPEIFGYRQSDE
jgi:hypothetical protein